MGCKCKCDSHAEAVLAKNSIANFTMDCEIGGREQTKEICLDAATQGTLFEIVVTAGVTPEMVEWTLGTTDRFSNPTAYVSDGRASELRYLQPFEDLRSASSGYGGGE